MISAGFLKDGFITIRSLFKANLEAVSNHELHIETNLQLITDIEFRAKLLLKGNFPCMGRVWVEGMHSENSICNSEGQNMSHNNYNEMLSLSQGNDLQFHALMAMGMFGHEKGFDMERLSPTR